MVGHSSLEGWPNGSALEVWRCGTGDRHLLVREGSVGDPRPWASVSKVAVAFGAAVSLDDDALRRAVGPRDATLEQLLAHAGGLGLEDGDPTMDPGVRRIYSNVGIDFAVEAISGSGQAASWLNDTVWTRIGLGATHLEGRASSGVIGSLSDMATLGCAFLDESLMDLDTRDRTISVHFADLAGVVPGFGRFDPCPWGLGVEVKGNKQHWMGTVASPRSFGHFGQSGTLLLVDPSRALVVAAASAAPFGPWAKDRWPSWMDEILTGVGGE